MANVHNDWLTNITFILYPNGVKNFEFYLSITPYAEPSGPSKSRAQYVVKFYHFPPSTKVNILHRVVLSKSRVHASSNFGVSGSIFSEATNFNG